MIDANAAKRAALETIAAQLAEERRLCEALANGSAYWQHKYERTLDSEQVKP